MAVELLLEGSLGVDGGCNLMNSTSDSDPAILESSLDLSLGVLVSSRRRGSDRFVCTCGTGSGLLGVCGVRRAGGI